MSRSRIESVVRVRRLQERIARGEVALARREVAARAEHRTATIRAVEELAAAAPTAGPAFVAHRRRVDGGTRAVLIATTALVDAAEEVERTLDRWSGARQRLDGVERLDDRLARAEAEASDRRIATEVDDLSVMRWNRNKGADRAESRMNGAP